MRNFNDEESNQLALQVASAMRKHQDDSDDNSWRFDRSINLGHVLTIVTIGAALATIWTNSRIVEADHESRIKGLETSQIEFKQTINKMAEVEANLARTQDKIGLTLDYISKKP